jgi:hypothetical protein
MEAAPSRRVRPATGDVGLLRPRPADPMLGRCVPTDHLPAPPAGTPAHPLPEVEMAAPSSALTRLAARDTASLTAMGIEASADDDKVAALSRLIGELHVPIMTAKYAYARLISHMQESDLTINFVAYKFFNKKPEGAKYVSQFEGGNTWGDPTYMSMRDEAEEAMFDYGGARATTPTAQAVQQRVKRLGERTGAEFEGAIRPKYAALNYARLKYGSAAQWGKSYMVLKEYVKHGATYVHTDSFDCAGSARQRAALANQVANFLNLQRLLVHMPAAMLTALEGASRGVSLGEAIQPPGLGSTAYIEAQVHSEIQFERDIQTMVINLDEVKNSAAETAKLRQQDANRWKELSEKKLRARFQKFAETYNIGLAYT